MNFTCTECNDTGSRDKLGTYLDCNACGTAATRRDLNDFVKSLGPTHPEDVALAIHQRALAMAPKQEFNCDFRAEGATFIGTGGLNPITYVPGGMRVDLSGYTCTAPIAAPAAANGALTDEQIKEICESTGWIPEWNDRDHIAFARAILAAAGPDAALIEAARNVVTCFNDPHTSLAYVQRWVNELAEVLALSGAKGN